MWVFRINFSRSCRRKPGSIAKSLVESGIRGNERGRAAEAARIAGAAVACLGVLLVAACSKPEQSVEIALTQQNAVTWRLDYALAQPVARLDLGPTLNGFRARDWRLETSDLKIVSENDRDFLVADNGAKAFRAAAFEIHPHRNGFAKQYEPIAPFADGGAVIYTGHFWPWRNAGERLPAHFSVTPRDGERVFGFGEEMARVSGWTSPFDHPAFLVIGPLPPVALGSASAMIDPRAPEWIAAALKAQTPRLLAELSRAFGRDLASPPDFFLMVDEADAPGRLRYSGDALPGQVMIVLSGGAWAEATPEARLVLLTATAHEAAHLWQMAARPRDQDVPAWIHEGGADAVAAEVLAGLGLAGEEGLAAARDDCRSALAGRSLAEAEAAGDWPASYSCGRVLAEIAARAASGGDVAAFWRELIDRAQAAGGYDEALFYSMIEEGAGRDFAVSVRRFPHTPFAAPDKELARLLDEASATERK